jgi:hypothetical protein
MASAARAAAWCRLGGLAHHILPTRAAAAASDGDGAAEKLREVGWAEIMSHNTAESAWVVIRERVYDMTEFIKGDHPGGEEIPLDYAGKDATEYWEEIHGHIADAIMADLAGGGGADAGDVLLDTYGLDLLPTVVGRTVAGPRPTEAAGLPQRNWSGTVQWRYEEIKTPGTLAELVEAVAAAPGQIRVMHKPRKF